MMIVRLVTLLFTAILCVASLDHTHAAEIVDSPANVRLPAGFVADTHELAGARLYYRKGGFGPGLILLHGFPEDGSAFSELMPALARDFTVVVPDLRGIGRSVAKVPTFDAEALATDIQQLAEALQLDRSYVVGHDMGGIVAHAMGRLHHRRLRGVMLIENPLPGFRPWDQIAADPAVWHLNFHQAKIAETLILGRQEPYFRAQFFEPGLIRKDAVDAQKLRRYAAAYGTRAQLEAGLALYQATPTNARFNQTHRDVIDIPLTLIGGEQGIGSALSTMAEDLRTHGWSSVTLKILPGAHYLLDENSSEIAAVIKQHASAGAKRR